MPNRWRIRACGRKVYSLPIMVWADDVSGNVSKQWNKHILMCMSNLAMPRQSLERESNIHFVGTSTFASPVEMMEGLVRMIEEVNQSGYEAFDAGSHAPVLFNVWLAILAGDNPLQAELCSHKGMQANKFCRRCHVGGTGAYKRTAEGYASLFELGRPRTSEETENHVRSMLEMAVRPGQQTSLAQYGSEHGIRDAIAEPVIDQLQEVTRLIRKRRSGDRAADEEMRTVAQLSLGAPFATNALFRLNNQLCVHRSTPVEALHTFLLGAWKYLWTSTMDHLEAPADAAPGRPMRPQATTPLSLLLIRLASLNETGWNLPKLNPTYIIQHRKQLIGKHFKALSQCLPFVLEDLVSPAILEAWVIAGIAMPLLWKYDILDKKVHEVRTPIDYIPLRLGSHHHNPSSLVRIQQTLIVLCLG
ncbi:hypothetical protein CALCODRAFT_531479 [Calocera cornea HHB12733]|uniref:Uncharacterized protein n=1 Tax=Calocera cornea HHB12733 TaxID=1353952 RepID=A0A165IIV5_9BASI|nr:hypothetical protein CALCODRAFT_531479 [Calocera cornea HHB12733]